MTKLPSAEETAIELCALLGINSNEIKDEQLPTYDLNRWNVIAEMIRSDRQTVLEAAAVEADESMLGATAAHKIRKLKEDL